MKHDDSDCLMEFDILQLNKDNITKYYNFEQPYIEIITIKKELKYNPKFGDDKVCKCGYTYYRHFDSYEEMSTIGCKYCECFYFEEM